MAPPRKKAKLTKPRSQRHAAATTSSDGEEVEHKVGHKVDMDGKGHKAHSQVQMASANEDESDKDCPSDASPDTRHLCKFSVFIILYLMYLMLMYFLLVK